jgi:peptidylprolyl isomerase
MIRLLVLFAAMISSTVVLAQELPTRVDPQNAILIETKFGRIVIKLRNDIAPRHAERMKRLAREKYYDNVPFHRVIAGFMAQTGDGARGDGTGGSKYPYLPAEFSNVPFKRGVVGMARANDPNSANSQFFIMLAEAAFLNGMYTVVGEVVAGMDVVDKIKIGEPVVDPDRMIRVQVAADAISSRSPPSRRDDKVNPPPAFRNKVASTGTGFFASDSGHIVTNAHVVKHCQTLRSSRGGQIDKVSIDEQSDLALYIASEKPKAFARLRGGYGARVGEPVVAVGFPLRGLLSSEPIVTTGIISALSGLRNDRRTVQITAPVG